MIICDLCTGQVAAGNSGSCETCQESKQYCRPCLKKLPTIDGTSRYCPPHWDVAKNALSSKKILTRYVRQFWKELGIKPSYFNDRYYDERPYFTADFHDLKLNIQYTANLDESGNLVSINHVVGGLVSNEKTYTIPIHNHEEAKAQVKAAIMTALKNKKIAYKSAKSKKLNDVENIVAEYDQKIADVDSLVKKWTNGNL